VLTLGRRHLAHIDDEESIDEHDDWRGGLSADDESTTREAELVTVADA
jgi:hypothetical protein